MPDQTTLNGSSENTNRRPSGSDATGARTVVGNATGVMHDITELLELQARLLVADSKTVARRAAIPIVLLGVGLTVLLGLMPVALEALAAFFVERFEWSQSLALLGASGCGLGISVLLLAIGWWRFRRGFRELQNSREELAHNISWIKQSLTTGGAATPAHPGVDRRSNT